MDLPTLNRSNLEMVLRHPSCLLYPFRDINQQLYTKLFRGRIEPGEDMMDKDWDNLIIADCARPDYFREINHLPGELHTIRSQGSGSPEFMRKTFEGNEFFDTIYVTANASYDEMDGRMFFYTERIYRGNTVEERRENAEQLVERTIEMHEQYPDKRLITHFMMPHTPYLSERAAELREDVADQYSVTFRTDDYAGKTDPSEGLLQLASLLKAKRVGLISNDQLRDVYREDLRDVLGKVETLSKHLDGKTVVTSDHGEFLGERLSPLFLRDWGHGDELNRDELREVPWFVMEGDERREIRSDSPIEIDDVDKEAVEETLAALGYK